MPKPLVSVIVINMDGQKFLGPCLDALRAQTLTVFETLLVDNASTDRSVSFVRENYPEVRILSLDHNHGFGGANNLAILAAHGEYIALLNNDTRVEKDWLEELVKAMETDPSIGMCASKMVFADEPQRVDTAGVELAACGAVFSYRHYDTTHEDVSAPRRCFCACAGAALYRNNLLDKIGGFDDLFDPAYFEDVDLGMRAQLAGYECAYVPSAVVYHHVSATAKKNRPSYLYLTRRNMSILLLKHYPLSLYIRYIPFRVLLSSIAVLKCLLGGQAAPIVNAHVHFLCRIGAVLKKRTQVRRLYKVSSKDVAKHIKIGTLRYLAYLYGCRGGRIIA